MLDILAQNGQQTTLLQQIIGIAPIIIVVLVFWFLMSSANRKKEREAKALRDNLKKGDRIQTIGGMLGTVVNVEGDEVVVKVDETTNTKIKFTRNAIHRVITEDAKTETK